MHAYAEWTLTAEMRMIAPRNAPVAQLDRVPPSEGGGRGFESRLVRHIYLIYWAFFTEARFFTPHQPILAPKLILSTFATGNEYCPNGPFEVGFRAVPILCA